MAVVSAEGLPVAVMTASAQPHESQLLEATLASRHIDEMPERVIADRAYDSDPLDERLRQQGVELIAPHRRGRKAASTQDGRSLRRYRRRWKVERFFAWLGNWRRTTIRWDRHWENFQGWIQLASLIILSSRL